MLSCAGPLRRSPAVLLLRLQHQQQQSRAVLVRALSVSRRGSAATWAGSFRSRQGTAVPSGMKPFSTLSDEELRRRMNEFNELFVVARDEIEFAAESKETTYFDEEAALAKKSTDEALQHFEETLSKLTEEKRKEIKSSSGLRVEQLKAELGKLLQSDDH